MRRVSRTRRTGAIVVLLIAALVVPVLASSSGNAVTEGCIAVGISNQAGFCQFASSGGNIQVVVAGFNSAHSVHKGPASNPFQQTCGFNNQLGADVGTYKCFVPAGWVVTGQLTTVGVLVIRSRPAGL